MLVDEDVNSLQNNTYSIQYKYIASRYSDTIFPVLYFATSSYCITYIESYLKNSKFFEIFIITNRQKLSSQFSHAVNFVQNLYLQGYDAHLLTKI